MGMARFGVTKVTMLPRRAARHGRERMCRDNACDCGGAGCQIQAELSRPLLPACSTAAAVTSHSTVGPAWDRFKRNSGYSAIEPPRI